MKISACTYVRNGFQFVYPFIQTIQSILPIVDEIVVVVGDSNDGTREAIDQLGSAKISIVDTVWDLNLRTGGKLFAQQSNIGLDHATGDWVIPIQVDEIIHEDDLQKLKEAILTYDKYPQVDGLLFPFLNFWGDYNHIQTGRQVHRFEIRAIRNNPLFRAYKDSQGFRNYTSLENYSAGEKGEKLKVVKIDVPVYHYFRVRSPKEMREKSVFFASFYKTDEEVEKEIPEGVEFDYQKVDQVEQFKGTHPKVMAQTIARNNWDFQYDPKKSQMSTRHRVLAFMEKMTGWRIGEYKNYKLIKI